MRGSLFVYIIFQQNWVVKADFFGMTSIQFSKTESRMYWNDLRQTHSGINRNMLDQTAEGNV